MGVSAQRPKIASKLLDLVIYQKRHRKIWGNTAGLKCSVFRNFNGWLLYHYCFFFFFYLFTLLLVVNTSALGVCLSYCTSNSPWLGSKFLLQQSKGLGGGVGYDCKSFRAQIWSIMFSCDGYESVGEAMLFKQICQDFRGRPLPSVVVTHYFHS